MTTILSQEEVERRMGAICSDPCRVMSAKSGCDCAIVLDTVADLRRQLTELEQMRQRDLDLAERHMNEKHELRRQLDEARALAGEHWADLCLANEKNDKLIAERDEARAALTEALDECERIDNLYDNAIAEAADTLRRQLVEAREGERERISDLLDKIGATWAAGCVRTMPLGPDDAV